MPSSQSPRDGSHAGTVRAGKEMTNQKETGRPGNPSRSSDDGMSLNDFGTPLSRSDFVRPIAHRGLHDHRQGVIENTTAAFEAAIAGGYGIECDVRPAAGGLPIVFHDATTNRLTSREGPTNTLTTADLQTLKHRNSDTPILTLRAALDCIASRTPVLIELKSDWRSPDPQYIAQLCCCLADYDGPAAIMSFDPDLLSEIRTIAPLVPRGLVATPYQPNAALPKGLSPQRAVSLAKFENLATVAPSFVAYNVDGLPTPTTEAIRASGHPVFAWTVRSKQQQQIAATFADAPIFENIKDD